MQKWSLIKDKTEIQKKYLMKKSLSIGVFKIAVTLVFLMASVPLTAQDLLINIDDKQTDKPAIVFLVAG